MQCKSCEVVSRPREGHVVLLLSFDVPLVGKESPYDESSLSRFA